MSILVTPLLNTGIHLTLSAAGNILYYTGSGIWRLGKWAIYGHQPTVEEQQLELIKQNRDLIEQVQQLREMVEARDEATDEVEGAALEKTE